MTENFLGTDMRIIQVSEFDREPWNGRLMCWEAPEPGELYTIGVDPAEGVREDRSCAQILKLGTMKHPDIQVAEFTCDFLDPVDFSAIIKKIGEFYADPDGTEAFCTIEVNAPCGDTMVSDLRMRHGYTNLFIRKSYDKINNIYTNTYGWSTNKATRPKLIARGLHALTYGDLIINSPYLLDEMSDFKRDRFDEKPEARRGKRDDRIMALLIAYYGAHDEEWISGDDLAEQRRANLRVEEAQKAVQPVEEVETPSVPERKQKDYQSRPISFKRMMDEANEELFRE